MFQPSSPFEITRRDPAGNASAYFPSINNPADVAALAALAVGTTYAFRGLALGPDSGDPDAFAPAGPSTGTGEGVGFIGFLTRDVAVGGLSLADRVFGRTTPTPTGLAGPFTAGDQVTVEKAMEFEAEGVNLLLTSGTAAISSATTVGTKLSFNAGRVSVAQSGEQAYFTLTANNLPASDGTSLRIRAEHL